MVKLPDMSGRASEALVFSLLLSGPWTKSSEKFITEKA